MPSLTTREDARRYFLQLSDEVADNLAGIYRFWPEALPFEKLLNRAFTAGQQRDEKPTAYDFFQQDKDNLRSNVTEEDAELAVECLDSFLDHAYQLGIRFAIKRGRLNARSA